MADTSSSGEVDVLKVVGSIVTSQVVGEKASKKWTSCLFCGEKGVVVARFQRRGY
jgi:hypothetical protein